ncbi:bifunctional hydroxymethylpyrimidine kinase/phosphomethylpyrimidine kinase [Bacteroides bouchesdurhonensis]|uniref:bifunctional hydroxymethylpyrimidine kinase/phosphomethylpyrimidine kinase n=1 Tax=Bacteroides bouchesdurhonensis TaxID=1841855 RepID=UPI0011DDE3D9|nr:bifunctional hydroxymethylpyrimidine kinase/phosphomethylpyrimidine kinase [Bacteroides bouchesdurhonensis]
MKRYPIILSIAGSDCSGGAGIQADIKTISALGGYAASAITAITIQNTLGVQAVHTLPSEIVCKQIEAVMDDLQPDSIKIGMVDDTSIVHVIADCIKKYKPQNIVYDPVMVSTSGRQLMTEDAILEIKKLLFPLTSLITPNLDEVAILTGKTLYTPDEMTETARELSELYNISVLIKGGHLPGDEMCDVLHTLDGNTYTYKEVKIKSKNLHGTGCTLSSAIATYLAKGYSMNEAVHQSKEYINNAIIAGKELNIGHGNGPLWHFPDRTAQK